MAVRKHLIIPRDEPEGRCRRYVQTSNERMVERLRRRNHVIEVGEIPVELRQPLTPDGCRCRVYREPRTGDLRVDREPLSEMTPRGRLQAGGKGARRLARAVAAVQSRNAKKERNRHAPASVPVPSGLPGRDDR